MSKLKFWILDNRFLTFSTIFFGVSLVIFLAVLIYRSNFLSYWGNDSQSKGFWLTPQNSNVSKLYVNEEVRGKFLIGKAFCQNSNATACILVQKDNLEIVSVPLDGNNGIRYFVSNKENGNIERTDLIGFLKRMQNWQPVIINIYKDYFSNRQFVNSAFQI